MDDHEPIPSNDLPLGWEPIADCGRNLDEAKRLRDRLRGGGGKADVVIHGRHYAVWAEAENYWTNQSLKQTT